MKYVKYAVLFLAALAALGFYYVNKPKKDIAHSTPDVVITADALLSEFNTDENTANTKYLDKIIEIPGIVRSISTDKDDQVTILLETDDALSCISCQLAKNEAEKSRRLSAGSEITIKGICSGFLMDVVLISCYIEN